MTLKEVEEASAAQTELLSHELVNKETEWRDVALELGSAKDEFWLFEKNIFLKKHESSSILQASSQNMTHQIESLFSSLAEATTRKEKLLNGLQARTKIERIQ